MLKFAVCIYNQPCLNFFLLVILQSFSLGTEHVKDASFLPNFWNDVTDKFAKNMIEKPVCIRLTMKRTQEIKVYLVFTN